MSVQAHQRAASDDEIVERAEQYTDTLRENLRSSDSEGLRAFANDSKFCERADLAVGEVAQA